ncbi:ABC transporter permease [Dokdonia sp. Hel_I_53]|uniref:ABC transporter permease n=1 Tax=Dokdonia sp. Hel_I_53 TaxID=1566287 RepID=UPI00119AE380|nr:FtsX-like permease family protein [Dokdonia sp. Hel_I_53]TVZ51031.1 lipoprotein-releasing system permease protein [Dokdonia sp. Hel_I_53]
MNLEYFIAKRLNGETSYKSSASSTIIKIAIVAIALGMVMMLVAISITLGLQREIRQKVSAFSGDMLVSNFDGNDSEETVNPVSINQDFYPDFTSVPEVTHVQAITTRAGIIRTAETFEGVMVKGLGDDYDWSRIENYIVDGRKPDFTGQITTETLMSTYLANRLNLTVGDKAIIYFVNQESGKFRPLRLDIVGLYESAFQEFDKVYIMADRRQLTRINKWEKDEVGAFEVFIDDFDEIERVNNEVYKNTGSTLRSISVIQKNYNIFEWIKLFDFNMILIIIVMILVAGINMIVALLVLVLERTQMIGVLKALGSSDWSIRKVFLYNAMYLIGLGLFWGNLIGLGLLAIQKYFGVITLNPATYYVKQAPVVLELGYILALNLGVFIVCVLMLLVPSFIITKISPVKAMRFD